MGISIARPTVRAGSRAGSRTANVVVRAAMKPIATLKRALRARRRLEEAFDAAARAERHFCAVAAA